MIEISNERSLSLNYGYIKMGKNRHITLTASDVNAIQKAYDILTKEACNPSTIKSLSKIAFLNEQKLKAGFLAKYHICIDEISKIIIYNYSGNFGKMFKKIHGKTPLTFSKIKG